MPHPIFPHSLPLNSALLLFGRQGTKAPSNEVFDRRDPARNDFKRPHAIASFFKTGKSPYPVERTLLASGLLEAAMKSHAAGGKVIETPELKFSYDSDDWSSFRENGASWKVITADTPQPTTFAPRST